MRHALYESGDVRLAERLGICRSTMKSLMRRGVREVFTLEVAEKEATELRVEVLRLERRVEMLLAIVRLLWMLVTLRGAKLDGERLPEGEDKQTVLKAIQRATRVISLDTALRAIGMSAARYHAWRQPRKLCALDDVRSCPKTTPTQLTAVEVREMHALVMEPALRHIPISRLAVVAQRLGKVYAHAGTWSRLVREKGWLRERKRVHPESPKVGIRATRPNEYWHVDVTLIRLLSGEVVKLQAVIDNYSRRILAWMVLPACEPRWTRQLLLEAARGLPEGAEPPTVVADSGSENKGEVVDLVEAGTIKRVLAMADVLFSNSMIEAWWRSLKHWWLYLNRLDTREAVERLTFVYVIQHNSVIPHSALGDLTPDEAYFGTGANVQAELAGAWRRAREARLAANRAAESCGQCPSQEEVANESQIRSISSGMQLHPPDSRMSG